MPGSFIVHAVRVLKQFSTPLARALAAALALAATLAAAPPAGAADRVDPRIVNAELEYIPIPWQAAIVRRDDNSFPMGVFCGGTIRDEWHVITAAHCVPDSNAAELDVAVAFVSRTIPGNTIQRVPVSAITSHPGYDDASKRNDLAILRLGAPLTLSGSTYPLQTIEPGASLTGAVALISGWGTTSSGGSQPDDLRAARVLVYPDAQCGGYGPGFDASVMLCAGRTQNGLTYDTCQGDSGGPLARMTNPNNAYAVDRLIGVVSFGRGCADPAYPGVYTSLVNPDLNARATAQNPPPRLEPAGPPAVAGTPTAGQTLTCTPGAWTMPPTGSSYGWLSVAIDQAGRATDFRAEGQGQTLTLEAADVGRIFACEETGVNDGGARTQLARPVGPIQAAPPPPPAPPAPPPPAPPVAPADIVPPSPEFTRRSCARRRCSLTITATDPAGPATSATVTYQRLTGCKRGRRGARCRRAKTIAARALGNGVFEVTTPRLAVARWRFTVVAVDAAGNRSAPVQVALRVARPGRAARRGRGRRGRRR